MLMIVDSAERRQGRGEVDQVSRSVKLTTTIRGHDGCSMAIDEWREMSDVPRGERCASSRGLDVAMIGADVRFVQIRSEMMST